MPVNYLHWTGLQDELEALRAYFESQSDYPTALRITISSLLTTKTVNIRYVARKIDRLCLQIQETGTIAGWCLVLHAQLSLTEASLEQGLFVRRSEPRLKLCAKLLQKRELRDCISSVAGLRLHTARLKLKLLNRFEGAAADFLLVAYRAHQLEAYSAVFTNLSLGLRLLSEDDMRSTKPWNITNAADVRAQLHFLTIGTLKSVPLLAFSILDNGDPLIWTGNSDAALNLVSSFWKSCPDFELRWSNNSSQNSDLT